MLSSSISANVLPTPIVEVGQRTDDEEADDSRDAQIKHGSTSSNSSSSDPPALTPDLLESPPFGSSQDEVPCLHSPNTTEATQNEVGVATRKHKSVHFDVEASTDSTRTTSATTASSSTSNNNNNNIGVEPMSSPVGSSPPRGLHRFLQRMGRPSRPTVNGTASTPQRSVRVALVQVSPQLTLFYEEALLHQARPLREFIGRLSVPSQANFLARLLVNLFFFSRNYMNVVLLETVPMCYFYPASTAIVGLAVALHKLSEMEITWNRGHTTTTTTTTSCSDAPSSTSTVQPPFPYRWLLPLLKLAQFATCVMVVLGPIGVFTSVVLLLAVSLPIVGHAFFTHETDAAYSTYARIMSRRGISAAVPRSPTKDLHDVDPSFAEAYAQSPSPSRTSGLRVEWPPAAHGDD